MTNKKSGCLTKLLLMAAILAPWYIYTGNSERFNDFDKRSKAGLEKVVQYEMPEVIETLNKN